jgi:hypothetical protein
MRVTKKIANESGHLIHFFWPQFAQRYTGWKKQLLCVLSSSAMFASPPLIILGVVYLWFGHLSEDDNTTAMMFAGFILMSILFSIVAPASEYLYRKLSTPYDWIVPGCIMACALIFSLWLVVFIRPPPDMDAILAAYGSHLRSPLNYPKGFMAACGVMLSAVIVWNYSRRSKQKNAS